MRKTTFTLLIIVCFNCLSQNNTYLTAFPFIIGKKTLELPTNQVNYKFSNNSINLESALIKLYTGVFDTLSFVLPLEFMDREKVLNDTNYKDFAMNKQYPDIPESYYYFGNVIGNMVSFNEIFNDQVDCYLFIEVNFTPVYKDIVTSFHTEEKVVITSDGKTTGKSTVHTIARFSVFSYSKLHIYNSKGKQIYSTNSFIDTKKYNLFAKLPIDNTGTIADNSNILGLCEYISYLHVVVYHKLTTLSRDKILKKLNKD